MPDRLRTAIFSVAGVVLVSKILGFLREIVIADKFGTSADYDLYLVAVMLPALVSSVLGFACYFLFVPFLSRKIDNNNDSVTAESWLGIWPMINLTFLVSLVMVAVIILVAPYIMKIWASGYLIDDFAKILFYSRITAAAVVLGTSEAFMRAYLNVRKVYTYPAAGYIVFNLCSIACVVLLHERFSVGAVVIGLLGGLLLQNVYLVTRLLRYKPFKCFSKSIITQNTGTFVSIAGVLVVIELIRGFYFLIDRYFAPQFGEGVISALNYSQVLVQIPESVVGFAIGAVLFPIFSSSQATADHSRFVSVYRKAISIALFIAVPLAVLFYVGAEGLVRLVYQRGVFDQNSTMITVSVLRPYAPTIIALFVISTSIRACYAAGWNRAVLYLALAALGVKFAATALLSRWIGYPGISAATSLAFVGYGAGLLVFVSLREKASDLWAFVWLLIRILLAGGVSLIVIDFVKNRIGWVMAGTDTLEVLLMFATLATAIALLYAGCAWGLGLKPFFSELIWNRRRKQSEQ